VLAASLALVLSGCSFGGSGEVSAAPVTSASATPTAPSTAMPVATGDSLSSSTPTPEDGGVAPPPPVATATREPLAYVEAVVRAAPSGNGFDITVWADVSRVGVSGLDISASSTSDAVILTASEAGTFLGSDALVAVASVLSESSARVAYARAGESERGEAAGVVAVFRVDAPTAEAVRTGLTVSLSFTDAGLTLHGPFEAALDLGDET
jgi:hypothetical protein